MTLHGKKKRGETLYPVNVKRTAEDAVDKGPSGIKIVKIDPVCNCLQPAWYEAIIFFSCMKHFSVIL